MTKPKQTIDLNLLPCEHLTGVGKRTAEHLARLGIHHIPDLLFHLPRQYQDRTRVLPIPSLKPGDHAVIEGTVTSVSLPKGGRTRLLCQLEDERGRIHLRFFYVNSIQLNTLRAGVRIRCFGEVRFGALGFEMIHPEYQVISETLPLPVENNLTPIYPTTEGLSQGMWRKLTNQALQMLMNGGLMQDILPLDMLEQMTYPTLKEALLFVHRPPPDASVDQLIEGKHKTQRRLVFEELLAHRLSLLHLKNTFQIQAAVPLEQRHLLRDTFLSQLSFQLTGAQAKVVQEIDRDMAKPHPMLRLVQGDVGSGKTVVAAIAILNAVENNYQAVILAPTELLVEQHYRTFQAWFAPLGIHVLMLSGQMKTKAKSETLAAIANGQAQVLLGTHAIFQKGVEFSNLALIVVDEQHRFGVQQRAMLREKGVRDNSYPHQLIMTATPIPRTLAMSVYADLDYSVIDELPPGRTPIMTRVISNTRRDEVLERIRQACTDGRQAYWVCTLIEESDALQCQAAENTLLLLRATLPELKIALLHGRMKPAEKEEAMSAFKNGQTHLLISTTVIEVGVDVPNASLMVIENAERLGLAQLHQLRGRVGRGSIESHCLLMYQSPLSRFAKERLSVMRETTDGFKIAHRDLELRGPGEVLGTKQTGDITLRIANLMRDSDLLPEVEKAANVLQETYPDSVRPLIKRWIGNNEQFGRV